jgi:hypothetical protein
MHEFGRFEDLAVVITFLSSYAARFAQVPFSAGGRRAGQKLRRAVGGGAISGARHDGSRRADALNSV